MYVTPNQVADATGKQVEAPQIAMAQSIIEMYTGRVESRVENPDDLALLRLATAYQAAYLVENFDTVFSQVGVSSLTQDKFRVEMSDPTSPFIAPLARMACETLSWRRSRSISTAPIFRGAKKTWSDF